MFSLAFEDSPSIRCHGHREKYWQCHLKVIMRENDGICKRRVCEDLNLHEDAWIKISEVEDETIPPTSWALRTVQRF